MKSELAAILFADVVGYSRLAGLDEEQTHKRLNVGLDLLIDKIQAFGGEKVNEAGDAILAEFHSVIASVNCAVEFQLEMMKRNEARSSENRLEFRVGVNLGEIIRNRGDIYGDGVNVAARIQEISEPGGVCISSAVYEQVNGKVEHTFDDLGHRKAKNITQTLHVYRVHLSDTSPGIESQPLFDFDSSAIDRSTIVNGGCMCGSVRYEVSQPWAPDFAIAECVSDLPENRSTRGWHFQLRRSGLQPRNQRSTSLPGLRSEDSVAIAEPA